MQMASAFVTDGKNEASFLEALLESDSKKLRDVLISEKELGSANRGRPSSKLPGTGKTTPRSADLDGFGFAMAVERFCCSFPAEFNISVGGASCPDSSIGLGKKAALSLCL